MNYLLGKAGISVVLSSPRSTGSVELINADPMLSPRVHLNFLQDGRDVKSMREGVRLAWIRWLGAAMKLD